MRTAPVEVITARVTARNATGRDASEAGVAVIARQVATQELLTADELATTFAVGTSLPVTARTWRPLLSRLHTLRG